MAETQQSSPIIGIDLGTTNSVAAAIVDGKVEVLTEGGQAILPSAVGIDPEDKLIVGTPARNQQVAFPDRTIVSIKRRMGSMDPVGLGDREFTPPEISAMILRRLRDRASTLLDTEVTRAVITVPAFFDENQRQATRQAGELAGLKVERIINEPTAATLVYHAGDETRKHIVVYDFGGGTFDVSVVRIEAGVVEVLSSHGDTRLGGDDLDAVLMKHVADAFVDQHGIDLRKDSSTRWRLLQACEAAKRELSSAESVTIAEEFIAEKDGKPLHLKVEVARPEYEKLIAPLVDRTIECLDKALDDSNLQVPQIDDLVLVGGTTRTPLVVSRLREEFQLEPSRSVDPDLAVALGAATQAAMLDGQSVGPVLVDVTTHTLGLEVMDGFGPDGPSMTFSPIIHRGTALPASYENAYSAAFDEQEKVEIHVLQGEHSDPDRNRSIGKFLLNLKDPSGHRSKILVRFDLSISGTLRVVARQVGNDQSEELTIDNALSDFKAQFGDEARARLNEMFDASDEVHFADEDRSVLRRIDMASSPGGGPVSDRGHDDPATQARIAAQKARSKAESLEGDDAEDLIDLADRLDEAIEQNDADAMADLCAELDDILFYVG